MSIDDDFMKRITITKLRGRPIKKIRLTQFEFMMLSKDKQYKKNGYLFTLNN
jgi:hypothetical protein